MKTALVETSRGLRECGVLVPLRSGKVREVFEVRGSGGLLLIVATDRISAYDCVLPTPVPGKGVVLTQLSAFWFELLDFCPNHFVAAHVGAFPAALRGWREELEGRAMLVKKAAPLPVECVVRGYLAGSAWEEYRRSGSVAGIRLPEGLAEAAELPEPIFTPATKAQQGHDENITWPRCRQILGDEIAHAVRDYSIELYLQARDFAAARGIVIADTKFEFGLADEEVVLIDEVLTPDSSRFWPRESWRPGINPPSFDKQYVRDYLTGLGWDRMPPPPELPPEVVQKTAEKYCEAYRLLTGRKLEACEGV